MLALERSEKEPEWLSSTTFKVESSTANKVRRLAYGLTFAYCIHGLYKKQTRMASYVWYLSLAVTVRKIGETIAGYFMQPTTQSSWFKDDKEFLDMKANRIEELTKEQFQVREIFLHKSGNQYHTYLITHPTTIDKRHWTIHAHGRGRRVERDMKWLVKENLSHGCNTLLITGPSVGKSGGWPTSRQMGEAYAAGLSYLEKRAKASHIVMSGYSLGGAVMAEGIMQHHFSKEIAYLAISKLSFASFQEIALATRGWIVAPIFWLTGIELEGISGAKKLSDLGIEHIIVQHTSTHGKGSDGTIPDDVSLAHALRTNHSSLEKKVYIESEEIKHSSVPDGIKEELSQKIKAFLT